MTNTGKMCDRIPSKGSNDKTADELSLANLQNKGKGGFQRNCHNYGNKGRKSTDYRAPKKDKGNKTNTKEGRNTKHCNHCHRDGHTEAECFRKPENPGYKESKSKGGNKASTVEIFLIEVETGAVKFVESIEPIKLYLVEMERYTDDIE